jgi:hypothetical protein
MSPDEKLLVAIFGTESQKELLKEENDFAKEWQEAEEICRLTEEWNPDLKFVPVLLFEIPKGIAFSKDGTPVLAGWFNKKSMETCTSGIDEYSLSKVIYQ